MVSLFEKMVQSKKSLPHYPSSHVLMFYIYVEMGISCPSHFYLPPTPPCWFPSAASALCVAEPEFFIQGVYHPIFAGCDFRTLRQRVGEEWIYLTKNVFCLVLNRDVICLIEQIETALVTQEVKCVIKLVFLLKR